MRVSLPLLALAGALALAGCGGSGPDAELDGNDVSESPVVEEPVNIPVINEVEEEETNTAEVLPPPAPPPVVSDDEQMREDADATGLTTRLPDDDGGETPYPPGEERNDAAPNP
ncbi:hypothetical protein [Sphingomonas sanxanigenens]|uniref:Argininosuccinate lyase n=1 Tax=Sphingomonas sanxanigenens DSM 19645 = NX02 TaxID=1123269 RepID=W0AA34_9SPHN|nr:hypothetical protein [Sphingomonas sanxanigenens]AHE52510.1 hypothetical protein NX02_03780 [Sphingomonas sanxanigenens DSM 19645 = NX02]